MKKIFLLCLALSLSSLMFAQSEEPAQEDDNTQVTWNDQSMETFAKSGGTHGFYFGFGGGYTNIGDFDLVNVETKFSYIRDQKFEIGFGGQTFQSFKSVNNAGENKQYLGGALGGMYLKAIFAGRKKVHFSIPLFLGAGAAVVFEQEDFDFFDCFDFDVDSASPFLVAEPGVNVEFNLSKMVGFEMGAKYRISSQTDFLGNGIENLNGLSVGAMLKVGLFDFGGKKRKFRFN